MTVTGGGDSTLPGADTSAPLADSRHEGTLAVPLGFHTPDAGITLASVATLEAGGEINRAVSGNGTVTATGQLIIGNAAQSGQFNQGGAPGVGGTLNVGGNAVVILSADTAILGSQTNIGPGGSLTALNGVQLGNPSSVDSTKVLTATGNATINANFVNNGIVNGPTGSGQELTFTQAVKGAGSTTGNIEYAASYSPGNSPDAVSVQNVLLDPTSTLIMELAGTRPAAGTTSWTFPGRPRSTARWNWPLERLYSVGWREFRSVQRPDDRQFWQIELPALGNGLSWNTGNLYTTGTISVTPEPSTLALLAIGALVLFGYGLRRRATRTAKPAFDQQDAPAILSFSSHASPASAARRAA